MQTTTHIIDYTVDKNVFMVFVNEDFEKLISDWNKRNSFPKSLRTLYKLNFNKLNSLTLIDWKKLILNSINSFLLLSDDTYHDLTNETVENFHKILLGFSYKYFLETGGNLDSLKIQKMTEHSFSFMLSSSDLYVAMEKT